VSMAQCVCVPSQCVSPRLRLEAMAQDTASVRESVIPAYEPMSLVYFALRQALVKVLTYKHIDYCLKRVVCLKDQQISMSLLVSRAHRLEQL
jgi:hypothetical protein